ncbi:uncharacterized protein LOC121377101 isoform X3 [Gigantopelta aegis]|uniref:uncharacterized protein LOC121377101 isoform X3 n=1 Tax=Gigantopelta aegis TaxID=1735272 RepID=UPI001B88ACA9|nr:uncharacterized protein LOC121377101 isoform X3 [Gigantopelta aegis]
MDTSSVCLNVFVLSAMTVCIAGFSLKLAASTVTPQIRQEVTLTCILDDARGFNNSVQIRNERHRHHFLQNIAYFYYSRSVCNSNVNDFDMQALPIRALCGLGTNTTYSTSKEYSLKMLLNVGEIAHYYCSAYNNGQDYYSKPVQMTSTNKVECACLSISGGGDVLTVTEGKQYDGFKCSTGDASPEPEIRLKLNDTSSANLSVRMLNTTARRERRPAYCSHVSIYDAFALITNTNLAYVPDRGHDGKHVYCSARNSEMGTNEEEVTSNKIRLIVQFGPLETEMTFDPAEDTYTVDESGSLTVNCSADCNPACTYIWTYLDRGIATGSRLSLIHITEQEAGYYKCTARNPGSGITADKYFKLYVEYSFFSIGPAAGVGVAVGVVVTSIVAVVICCVARRLTKVPQRSKSKRRENAHQNTANDDTGNHGEADYEDLRT